MMARILALGAVGALFLTACGGGNDQSTTDAVEDVAAPTNAERLEAVLAGEHRTKKERARDQYRNPAETLLFFGIEPNMTVVEVWPGGGWYTQIIAPYLKGEGVYYGASFSRLNASERALKALARFEEDYVSKPGIYGDVRLTGLSKKDKIAPDGSADAVLTFRNVHNWTARGSAENFFAQFYAALKPGGILGVVEHRADGADLPLDGTSGYVYQADVIALAKAAGFELVDSSDINANPADTKDHPFGVWTLPPVRRESEVRGVKDPDFDHAPYNAIGESDRMTLKFVKPLAADGALLE